MTELPTHFVASDGWQYADFADCVAGKRESCSHNYEKAIMEHGFKGNAKVWAAILYQDADKRSFLAKLVAKA